MWYEHTVDLTQGTNAATFQSLLAKKEELRMEKNSERAQKLRVAITQLEARLKQEAEEASSDDDEGAA